MSYSAGVNPNPGVGAPQTRPGGSSRRRIRGSNTSGPVSSESFVLRDYKPRLSRHLSNMEDFSDVSEKEYGDREYVSETSDSEVCESALPLNPKLRYAPPFSTAPGAGIRPCVDNDSFVLYARTCTYECCEKRKKISNRAYLHERTSKRDSQAQGHPSGQEGKCRRIFKAFPYSTMIACLSCAVGGGLFAAENHVLEYQVLQGLEVVAHVSYPNLETSFVVMTSLGGLIVALSVLIFGADAALSVANASSAAKYTKIRTPSRVFMLIMYPAIPIWTALFGISVACLALAVILNQMCYNPDVINQWTVGPPQDITTASNITKDAVSMAIGEVTDECQTRSSAHNEFLTCVNCINMYQFHFLFPKSARKKDMWFCKKELTELCDVRLPLIVPAWINCVVGASLVMLGIALHMTILSYQSANASEQKKLRELEDRHYIRQHVQSAILRKSMVYETGSTLKIR